MNASQSWLDPVVAEIHATREQLSNRYHNDMLAYSKAAEARCMALGMNMAEDQHLHFTSPSADKSTPSEVHQSAG